MKNMKQISQLFLRNVTCIDHAILDNVGFIRGGSYHQEIKVSGEVDEHEQVVVDFSNVKSEIKKIIDDPNHGYDHKLWIIKGWSDCKIDYLDDYYIQVSSRHHTLTAPRDALKIMEGGILHGISIIDYIQNYMSNELEEKLNKIYKTNHIKIELKLTEEIFGSNPSKFTYYHGLKNSSSWGCKNIAHGHTSFVEVYNSLDERVFEVEDIIRNYLDGALILYKENLIGDNKIAYSTSERGLFSLSFSDDVKTVIMDKETTIENIVEHVYNKLKIVLDYYDVSKIFISEGLQKGAIKNCNTYICNSKH